MKKVLIAALLTIAAIALPVGGVQSTYAIDLFSSNTCGGVDCSVVKSSDSALANRVQNIINTALLVMGGIAVIVIVVGAIRMIVANGDPGNIKSGRLTILWAIVGMVVVIMASVIVNFVVNWGWLK